MVWVYRESGFYYKNLDSPWTYCGLIPKKVWQRYLLDLVRVRLVLTARPMGRKKIL